VNLHRCNVARSAVSAGHDCLCLCVSVYVCLCVSVDEDQISKAQLRLTDIAEHLEGDWVLLAEQLGITPDEIAQIQNEYHYIVEQVCMTNGHLVIVCDFAS